MIKSAPKRGKVPTHDAIDSLARIVSHAIAINDAEGGGAGGHPEWVKLLSAGNFETHMAPWR
jgi:hypothetical protein